MRSYFSTSIWYCCGCGDGPWAIANHVSCTSCDKRRCDLCEYEKAWKTAALGASTSYSCPPPPLNAEPEHSHIGDNETTVNTECLAGVYESSPETYCPSSSSSGYSVYTCSTPGAVSPGYTPPAETCADPQHFQSGREKTPSVATQEDFEVGVELKRDGEGHPNEYTFSDGLNEPHFVEDSGYLSSSCQIPFLNLSTNVDAKEASPRGEGLVLLPLRPKSHQSRHFVKPGLCRTEVGPSSPVSLVTRESCTITAKRTVDKRTFVHIWMKEVLPHLEKVLPTIIGSNFAVDLFRERSLEGGPSRAIHITSPRTKPPDIQNRVEQCIFAMLPKSFRSEVIILYFDGAVEKAGDVRGVDEAQPDLICEPQWTQYMKRPLMGASIGVDEGPDSATLGGYITINGKYYALTVHHLFEDEQKDDEQVIGLEKMSVGLGNAVVTQPSGPDKKANSFAGNTKLGEYVASSGYGRRKPFGHCDYYPASSRIEMDWALCSILDCRIGLNILPTEEEVERAAIQWNSVENQSLPMRAHLPSRRSEKLCPQRVCEDPSDILVHCMARTSSYQVGITSEAPSLVNYSNGHPCTYEWAVMRDKEVQTDSQWISRGVGLPGDSGTWILQRENNAVCGMVWGRVKPYGPGERKAYFTPIQEIFMDIERVLVLPKGSIELPQEVLPTQSDKVQVNCMNLNSTHEISGDIPESSGWRSSLYSPGRDVMGSITTNSPIDSEQRPQIRPSKYSFHGLDATLMGSGSQFIDDELSHWIPSGMEADLEELMDEGIGQLSGATSQLESRKRNNNVVGQTLEACFDCSSISKDNHQLFSTLQRLRAGDEDLELHLDCLSKELEASKSAGWPTQRALAELVGTIRSNKRRKVNDTALDENARILFRGSNI